MKQLFIINSHSIIDVITNSSSELFVCKTNKTLEAVKDILASNKNLYGYEEPWLFHLEEFREWKKKEEERRSNFEKWREEHEDLRDNPFSNSDDDWNNPFYTIDGWFKDEENEEDLKEARKRIIENGPQITQWIGTLAFGTYAENPFRDRLHKAAGVKYDWKKKATEVDVIYEELEQLSKDEKPDWWRKPIDHIYDQPVQDLDGCVIIISEGDNSMPYDEFNWIEDTFNATRTHLG